MILTPLPFQCVIKCVLWGEGVNKNYLEIWDDKRRLPGYLIYVHHLPKIHEQWKSPWSLGYIGCNYIGDNLTTELSGDYKKPLSSSWLTNQYDGKCEFFFRGSHVATTMIWGYPKVKMPIKQGSSWLNHDTTASTETTKRRLMMFLRMFLGMMLMNLQAGVILERSWGTLTKTCVGFIPIGWVV